MSSSKQQFIKGAIILSLSNMIVKIIAAVYKIPLTRYIGADGMGIYQTSYSIYNWLFIVATAGLPVAISKMVAENRHSPKDAQKIFAVSFYLLLFIGIIGSLILFLFAKPLAAYTNNPKAALAIISMSPSLLFVAIISSYRGYFQGNQNMTPTAVSQVCEVLGKLCIGLFLAVLLMPKGVEYAAAGAMFGITCGNFLGLISVCIFHTVKKSEKISLKGIPIRQILKKMIAIAVPITLGASVFSLTNLIDTATIIKTLLIIGYNHDDAIRTYGYYSGYAVTLFSMPTTVITAITVSIVPMVSPMINNKKAIRELAERILKITILFSLPCAAGLMLLSSPILTLLYKDDTAKTMLIYIAPAIIFIGILMITNAILQALGKIWIPVINMTIGGITKIIINYFLVLKLGILGAPIATNACYITTALLNLIFVYKYVGIRINIMELILKPLFCTILMGAACFFTYKNLPFGNSINCLLTIGVSGVVYLIIVLLTNAVDKEEINLLLSRR